MPAHPDVVPAVWSAAPSAALWCSLCPYYSCLRRLASCANCLRRRGALSLKFPILQPILKPWP